MELSKKNINLLLKNLRDDYWRENASIPFIRKIFFKRDILPEFQINLHAACTGQNITVNVPAIRDLINCLHSIYTSDLSNDIKAGIYRKFLQAFAKGYNTDDSIPVLQFFVVICHLLGLEQKVQLRKSSKSEEPPTSVINPYHFENAFGVSCTESSIASYVIVISLIDELSIISPNLNVNLEESTFLQWFQSFALLPVSYEKVSSIHLNFLCACSYLNTTLIEKNFSKILIHLFSLSSKTFKNEEYVKSFNHFMESMLQMYSKLQRLQKFMEKLLLSIQSAKSNLSLRNILSDNFVNEFSHMITLLPSMQSLSCMDDLLKVLDDNCVKTLEGNAGCVKTILVRVICALLSAFLRGVRVLSHTTPVGILKSFLEKMRQLKELLGRFGKSLLVRTHDRDIVQPFLNLCFNWGEFQLLIVYYAPEYSEQCMNKDISPTDLSSLHSYLSGEEWNVIAERVSNFGAVQCYQSFLRLILQKLRIVQLKKPYTSISGEGTSKYVLTLLTCELYKHDIIEELTPEDVASLMSYLTEKQLHLLLDKLYTQALESENSDKLINWLAGSVLLENRNFIISSLVIIFNKFGANLKIFNENKANDPFAVLCLDFIDESYNVSQDNHAKAIEKLNELLCDKSFRLNEDVKMEKFWILLDAMKNLPIINMSPEVCSLALTVLTLLAIIFSNFKDFLKSMLYLIFRLSTKTVKSNVFSNFNIGLFIEWLLHLNPELGDIRNQLLKMFLKKVVITEKGRNELKQLIREIRKRKFEEDWTSLEHKVVLYQNLGKSWLRTKKTCLENEEIMKYRNKLSKQIRKILEKNDLFEKPNSDPEVLVNAYCIELIRVIKKKKEEDIARLINLNFEKFFNISLSKVKAGEGARDGYYTFLTNILIHFPTLRDHLNRNTLRKIWDALKAHPNVDWKLFCRIANDEEFQFFLNDLLKTWKIFQRGKLKKMNLEGYFNIWKEFFDELKTTKCTLYENYLKLLFMQFSAGMTTIQKFSTDEIVQLFGFIRFCISTGDLAMTSPMIDISFDMMYEYEYKNEISIEEFQKIFESSVMAASWLFSTRKVRVKDKIHNVFQLFNKLLKRLIVRSLMIQNATEEELLALSSCSHNLEKWTSKMVAMSKDFSRMTVYFIAALVSSVVKVGIYPVVKASLANCIYKFLSISDPHTIAHLSMVLNPGSQQVFSGIYKTYKTYYRFQGKV